MGVQVIMTDLVIKFLHRTNAIESAQTDLQVESALEGSSKLIRELQKQITIKDLEELKKSH